MPASSTITPAYRLWIEILRQTADLHDVSAEAAREILQGRGFPDDLIDEYLEARDG